MYDFCQLVGWQHSRKIKSIVNASYYINPLKIMSYCFYYLQEFPILLKLNE